MGLTLKNKAVFEWDDGISKTTIPLSPDDDPETLVRKLRKVLELVEPAKDRNGAPLKGQTALAAAKDRVVGMANGHDQPGLEMPSRVSAGGWHKAPEPPGHWQGETEVIPQEGS